MVAGEDRIFDDADLLEWMLQSAGEQAESDAVRDALPWLLAFLSHCAWASLLL